MLRAAEVISSEIPDYERYNYLNTWRDRDIEDRAEREIVRRWATTASRRDDALDLGGGFGRISQVLETRFSRVFMLDYSLNNLTRASTVLKKTKLIRSELARLPFEDDSFDFITLVRVMQHIPQPDTLLAEVARVARSGATFVLGIANERFTGHRGERYHTLARITPEGHRIYVTPLSRYGGGKLEREEIRGVGIFDNRIGRNLRRLSPLSKLDVATSRLWPMKPMIFVRFKVSKAERLESVEPAPWITCDCGGYLSNGGVCQACGRSYGEGAIIDLVAERKRKGVTA